MFWWIIALRNKIFKNHPPTGWLHQLWLEYNGIQMKVPFPSFKDKFYKLQVVEQVQKAELEKWIFMVVLVDKGVLFLWRRDALKAVVEHPFCKRAQLYK